MRPFSLKCVAKYDDKYDEELMAAEIHVEERFVQVVDADTTALRIYGFTLNRGLPKLTNWLLRVCRGRLRATFWLIVFAG